MAGLPAVAPQSVGGYSIMAIMSAFQAEHEGSIPSTRSKEKQP